MEPPEEVSVKEDVLGVTPPKTVGCVDFSVLSNAAVGCCSTGDVSSTQGRESFVSLTFNNGCILELGFGGGSVVVDKEDSHRWSGCGSWWGNDVLRPSSLLGTIVVNFRTTWEGDTWGQATQHAGTLIVETRSGKETLRFTVFGHTHPVVKYSLRRLSQVDP